ncbi:GNAT family N-acetyltransferase [Sungkyunkwania multivorans]|uniref:GNAT family N-acetyltransferase n=1 Tax=Sungkyunkwania multivorans TaxID=1173618 RepID=A0ABW3CTN9_9FLAO
MKVRTMRASDWVAVARIYEEGIATGMATFESSVPSWEDWDMAHMRSCRFVVENDDTVLAWAALTPVSSRCVYAGVAEVSVYAAANARGKGLGKLLLKALISASEKEGIWTLQAGIFPNNVASLKLHRDMGFRLIGKRERIGKLHGIWHDNCILERRSDIIGID